MGGKRGSGNEEKENREGNPEVPPTENLTTSTTVFTVPATTDQFMHTPEFRRHFVDCVPDNVLMALRSTTKAWRALAEAFIDKDRESGAIMVHDGKGISWFEVPPDP